MPSKKSPPAPVPETLSRLEHLYGDASCSLDFGSAYNLLVATILSAQCTDARVNMVTPAVFRRWPDAPTLAAAPPGALEEVIKSTGFFNAKAKSLRGMAKALVEKHAGDVPSSMSELLTLPGVGRKTANVVLGNVWGTPDGVVVDTHVGRLSRRLGWTKATDPGKVEQDLNRQVPKERWTWLPHALIQHGRRICTSQRPKCDLCTLADICPKVGVETEKKEKKKGKTKTSLRGRGAKASGALRRARLATTSPALAEQKSPARPSAARKPRR
jgi:endonuclease-3